MPHCRVPLLIYLVLLLILGYKKTTIELTIKPCMDDWV